MSRKYGDHPADADDADADQRNQSRNKGVSVAAHRAGHNLDDSVDDLGAGDKADTNGTGGDDGRITVENAKQCVGKYNHQHGGEDGHNTGLQHTGAGDLAAARKIARAIVLSGKGCAGLAEGIDKIIGKYFNIKGSGRGGHHIGSEGVDGRLNDNIGKGKDRALQAGRNPDG